ncbi:baseplate J/gp47 family protein [Clostridium tagluense]|uniref:baseplate J/gp47 family protein n=1 Tax=Clostridium tagluense TaxID=360422 RepID=UPI001CF19402|nr:baseplate J/gp47 family protein [Clostridium tagluense]MCB2310643.1 baseplate J/gp47 family protein [Clostridium tagluense]MCB2315626.1 baseplate J/gp47 family protein [Clostridium tagluense]MCB2320480.1 baseplate J/gp47 family protein [Clostridium tagluense]MCB2325237.1 baseplate J/gp47 family protein [Clostridium tagluense]MCB2330089.1 baseplate J/gp47 family protein [Clostridium tagluense]
MSDSAETIQSRLLGDINPEYDKTEGSFFYDAEMPVSIELEKSYKEQESIFDKGFADTATGVDLERVVASCGIVRKPATKATSVVIITGTIGAVILKGDKVASDSINFIFTEDKIIDATLQVSVNVECEIEGVIGNVPVGAIKYFPITLAGLVSVANTNNISNGYNAELDEDLRIRYYEYVRTPATSGNKWHYRNWAKEVIGVGNAKVFPLWDKSNGKDGAGTVKVVIINSNKSAADVTLINAVSQHIEEERPIGATVTVISAIEKTINATAKVILASGYNISDIHQEFLKLLDNYLKDIAFADTYLSYAKLGNILLNTPGALDYTDLKINNGISNIGLQNEEIPIIGTVELGV